MSFLLEKGMKILNRNYRTKMGEIDIIAEDGDGTLAFIEVKSARSLKYGNPLYRIGYGKQKTIASMARYYLIEHKLVGNKPCRFDVISVIGDKIDHLKNAFFASY